MPSRDLFVVLQLRCPHRALISLKSTLPIPPVAPTLVQRHRAYCDKPDESLCFERNGIVKSDEMPAELMGHAYLKNVTFDSFICRLNPRKPTSSIGDLWLSQLDQRNTRKTAGNLIG